MNLNKFGQGFVKSFAKVADAIPAATMLKKMDNADKMVRKVGNQSLTATLSQCCQAIGDQAEKIDREVVQLPSQVARMAESQTDNLSKKVKQIPAEKITRALDDYCKKAERLSQQPLDKILEDFEQDVAQIPGKVAGSTVGAFQKAVDAIPMGIMWQVMSNLPTPSKGSTKTLNETAAVAKEVPPQEEVVTKTIKGEPLPSKEQDLRPKEEKHFTALSSSISLSKSLMVVPRPISIHTPTKKDGIDLGIICLGSRREIVALPKVLRSPKVNKEEIQLPPILLGTGKEVVPLVEKNGREGKEKGDPAASNVAAIATIASFVGGKMVFQRAGEKSENKDDLTPPQDPPEMVAPTVSEVPKEDKAPSVVLTEESAKILETDETEKSPSFWLCVDMQTLSKVAAISSFAIGSMAASILLRR